jgi:dihydrofolate reductase
VTAVGREVVLYVTASLDGFIADLTGGVGWLGGAEGEDYGFAQLMASVDTVLQGSHTHLTTLELSPDADPYEGKANYVFTSREDLPSVPSATFVHEDVVAFVRRLKTQPGGRIWLVGGGELASSLMSAGLVDEVDLFVQPILLGDGIPLWRPPLERHRLELLDAAVCPGDLARLHYRVLGEP